MTDRPDAYGDLIEARTLKIQRMLPGPVERVWAYLTESDKRRQWLAAGEMDLRAGAPFEFVWRNDELTNPPGHRPDGFPEEDRMTSRVIEAVPPHRLVIGWGAEGEVSFDLEPKGDKVLLTLVHSKLPERRIMLNIAPGWHAHLDVLAARLGGGEAEPFWDHWQALKQDYDKRLPA